MAERVHPKPDSPPPTITASKNPVPPTGTYVIQLPKDQIYRYPPPENAKRQQNFLRKSRRHGPCFTCGCWTFSVLFALLLLLAVTAAIVYLVFRPKSPTYDVNHIAIRGLNVTSRLPLSPEFDVTIRANNPNDKVGIYYINGGKVDVFYSDVRLCNGVWPVFYQPSNNVTVFETALRGSGMVFSSGIHSAMVKAETEKKLPLRLTVKVPVKVKVGGVKTWEIKVKVTCKVTVDSLTAESKILSKDCDYSVKLW